MYPVLPFGPFSIPTGPVIILIASTIGLEMAGRYGRRFGLTVDDVWNSGLIAILAGLIVARLWNVIQFGPVYLAEPALIISLRPSGFVLVPGLIAAAIALIIYLIRRALEPVAVVVALSIGIISAWAMIQTGGLLTGELLGLESDVPWAVNYYGQLRHPVALYYGIGLALLVIFLWLLPPSINSTQILLIQCLGVGLIYLCFGAFEYNASLIGNIRSKQLVGFVVALLAALTLSRNVSPKMIGAKDSADISDK